MSENLNSTLENILITYSKDPHFDTLLEAKNKYFELTGIINEEDEEFEFRMNCFNDWYLFHFLSDRSYTTVIKNYLESNQINDKVSKALLNVNHSLFEFIKVNRRSNIIIRDLISRDKYEIQNNLSEVTLMDNDIFTGRLIYFDDNYYLLKGLCFFPIEVRSILVKECKKYKKSKDLKEKTDFLLKLEFLKTKYIRYGHLDSKKIFRFD